MIGKVAARPSRPEGPGAPEGVAWVGSVIPKLGEASLTRRDITKEGRVSARAFGKVEFPKVEAKVANEGLFFSLNGNISWSSSAKTERCGNPSARLPRGHFEHAGG